MLGQGWLHHDVSVGNVLTLDTPVVRPPPKWYVLAIHSCCSSAHGIIGRTYANLGMVIDGDQAYPWDDVGDLPSGGLQVVCLLDVGKMEYHVSNNPAHRQPGRSCREDSLVLISHTRMPKPGLIQTPVDDLESFSWLLLWVVLKKLEQVTVNPPSLLMQLKG